MNKKQRTGVKQRPFRIVKNPYVAFSYWLLIKDKRPVSLFILLQILRRNHHCRKSILEVSMKLSNLILINWSNPTTLLPFPEICKKKKNGERNQETTSSSWTSPSFFLTQFQRLSLCKLSSLSRSLGLWDPVLFSIWISCNELWIFILIFNSELYHFACFVWADNCCFWDQIWELDFVDVLFIFSIFDWYLRKVKAFFF